MNRHRFDPASIDMGHARRPWTITPGRAVLSHAIAFAGGVAVAVWLVILIQGGAQ